MNTFYGFFVVFISCGLALAREATYRAGIISLPTIDANLEKYVPLIQEAAESNADIVVLPSPQIFSSSTLDSLCGADNYDELVKTLSEASKQAGLYVVAHLLEKTRCQGKYELIRSNLVFDRTGNVATVYRKPVNSVANCTTPSTEIGSFTTDFGVQFGLLMEEDLVLQKAEELKGLKNFVVTGAWSSDVPVLSAPQFAASWAFTNNVNLVTSSGVFAGRNGVKTGSDERLTVTQLAKTGGESHAIVPPVVSSSKLKDFPGEDLSQYIIKPLDLAASARGYNEIVCHGDFCCEFFVKASFEGPKEDDVNYGLAAFDGVRHFSKHDIGVQTCAIFACAGLYKRSCTIGSNSTNVVFEKISIHSNFTSGTSQYPIILTTTSQMQPNNFNFDTKVLDSLKQVSLKMSSVKNVLSFGIVSRDFSKDFERASLVYDEVLSFNDEMQELFDYLWIRLRILIFVVSIYFLEMM